MLGPTDLEVDSTEVLRRTKRLRLPSAEAARLRVQRPELDMDHALRRRAATQCSGDEPLLTLPNELLLGLLAYLPPDDVVSCSVMCRRLHELCKDPNLWRRVSVKTTRDQWWRAALRLAPCLRELDLTFLHPSSEAMEAVVSLMSRSACVITKLRLDVTEDVGAAWTAALVEKAAALGGGSVVHIFLSEAKLGNALWNGDPLFKALQNVRDLREFIIRVKSKDLKKCATLEVSDSLRKLTYCSVGDDRPFLLEQFLDRHASTLEHACLFTNFVPVHFLTAVPRLRSFTCRLNHLCHLKAWPSLETLVVLGNEGYFPSSALDFLRGAPQLRSVTLPGCWIRVKPYDSAVCALAESPSATILETLHLMGVVGCLSQVAGALPKFPSLQTLAVVIDTDQRNDLLPAVSPKTAPRLTMLEVSVPLGVCLHAWMHDSAQAVLKRNPRLHLRTLFGICLDKARQCYWCRSGCHSGLDSSGSMENGGFSVLHYGGRAAFAAHARMTGCPRDCFRWSC